MSICSTVKGYTRRHEWLADFFSLLAVAVLFATVWAAIEFNGPVLEWMRDNAALHVPAVVGALALDVALIFGLLCAGSQRCPEGSDDCFRTFRGRRHGSPSLFTAFGNWIDHIEHVGKKHR
jgi:hypothetical protein